MGADIHLIAQRKTADGWETIDPPEGYQYESEFEEQRREWYGGRNYVLFGILAGVRNYDMIPIARPKGIPEDMETEEDHNYAWGYYERHSIVRYGYLGDHSFSWLTVRELQEYPLWNETIDDFEYVSLEVDPKKYVKRIIKTPLLEYVGYFYNTMMPALAKMDPNPDNVRIVFGFDS